MHCISRKGFISCQLQRRLAIKFPLLKYSVICLLRMAGPVHCMCGGSANATWQTTVFLACLWEHSPVTHLLCSPTKEKRLTGEDHRRLTLLHRFLLSLAHTLQVYYSSNVFEANKSKLIQQSRYRLKWKYTNVDVFKSGWH